MLSLFIDESGQFEHPHDAQHAVVGGLLIKHKDEAELQEYVRSVQAGLADICGQDYHRHLHGKDRNFDHQRRIIAEMINARETKDRVVPIYIVRTDFDRIVNSNITDDNTACMLYFNMLNTLVSDVLLYYPYMLAQEREIGIHVASRAAVHNGRDERQREAFEAIGMKRQRGASGDALYYLNNETSVLMHLNHELRDYPFLQRRLSIQISKQWISYERRDQEFMELFYLADIVCNHVYHSKRNPSLYGNSLIHAIAFAYGSIDDDYRMLFRAYQQKQWFEFYSHVYRLSVQYAGMPMLKVYKKYIGMLADEAAQGADRASIDRFLFDAQQLINSGNYNRGHALYLLESMESLRLSGEGDLFPASQRVIYYDMMLQVHNHIGAYDRGEEIYRLAMEAASAVGSFEAVNHKRAITNRFATTCTNGFDFLRALELNGQLIDSQLEFRKLLEATDLVLFESERGVEKDLHLGRLYSSRGQFLAFLRQDEAYEWFHQALALFADSEYNRRQTVSYLIHFLCESDRELAAADREIVDWFFGSDRSEDRVHAMLSVDEDELLGNVAMHFQLFALVKWYRYRYRSRSRESGRADQERLLKLAQRVAGIPVGVLEHPWQLIMMNLGEMVAPWDRKLGAELLKRACVICDKPENQITLKLIGKMIQVRAKRDEASIHEFVELVRATENTKMNEYFEIERLLSLPIAEKVNMVLSKFTFTYC